MWLLTDDLSSLVARHLDAADVSRLCCVSRRFRHLHDQSKADEALTPLRINQSWKTGYWADTLDRDIYKERDTPYGRIDLGEMLEPFKNLNGLEGRSSIAHVVTNLNAFALYRADHSLILGSSTGEDEFSRDVVALTHHGSARLKSLDVSYSGPRLDRGHSQGVMSSLTKDVLTTVQHLKLPWDCCLGAAINGHTNAEEMSNDPSIALTHLDVSSTSDNRPLGSDIALVHLRTFLWASEYLTTFIATNIVADVMYMMQLLTKCRFLQHIDLRSCKEGLHRQDCNLWSGEAVWRQWPAAAGTLKVLLLGQTASPKLFHGATASRGLKRAMSGLTELDVSEPALDPPGSPASSLGSQLDSPFLLCSILEAAVSLKRLAAHGWGKGFPGEKGASAIAASLASHPVSLYSLSVSWGFNSMELRQAISSSRFLTSLTVALGAQLCDYDLRLLASSCPYLEHLTLSFQQVSDKGVCPLIEKCKGLRGLSLLRCSGPFTDALGASFRARRPLQLLQKLRIVDGARDITDNGLKTLLDRSCAQLQALELVRCVMTSSGSLRTIAAHSATLQELSLDRLCKGGAYTPGYRGIRPLLVCRQLRVLCLRHTLLQWESPCCALNFLLHCFPLLRTLSLDAFDLKKQSLDDNIQKTLRYYKARIKKTFELRHCKKQPSHLDYSPRMFGMVNQLSAPGQEQASPRPEPLKQTKHATLGREWRLKRYYPCGGPCVWSEKEQNWLE